MRPKTQVDALLSSAAPRTPRTKASFNLNSQQFECFRTLCDQNGITQSDLIDALIADMLTKHGITQTQAASRQG